MPFKDYYNGSPPEPIDLYEIFCVDCEHCTFDGECELSLTPEDCARSDYELAESCRDDWADRKADERRNRE
jgi:hypothetical protein